MAGGPRLIELSHPIRDGLVTYPGLPAPTIGAHLSRADSRSHYAPPTEFHIGTIAMVGNTGTYIDTPYHRYPDGFDLAGLPAEAVFDLDGVVVRVVDRSPERRAIEPADLAGLDPTGRAVLLHSGWSSRFGTPDYAVGAPFLGEAAARFLADAGAALVGIDAINIDDTTDLRRPAHTILLGARIPILEHLTNLAALPDRGFRLTALPPRIEGLGTFPVRAIARLDD